jgi:DEAD/DEAH box helicase domain-containing protein
VDAEPWLEVLGESEVLHQENGRWEWIADSYPANAVSLRSVADGNFVVVDRTDGRQQILAEVDYSAAALTLYEGAIHMIQSTPYQVERLDWEGRKAYVTRTHVDYYTDAIDYTKLKVLERFDGCIAGDGAAQHGEVHVVRRVSGYKKIRYYTHENIGYGPVSLPDQELHTTAVWWQLSQAVLDASFASRQHALDGFLGAAHALHIVATVAVMADARDLQKSVGSGDGAWVAQQDTQGRGQLRAATPDGDGASPLLALERAFVPTVYLYDNFPGGVGLSEPLFRRQSDLVLLAHELVARCDCRGGCPACVGPVLAQDEHAALTPKALAAKVLSQLHAAIAAAALDPGASP